MSEISGQARLAKNPELKYVGQGDDKQPVCEMRVRMLNSKQKKNSEDWIDNGFWVQVSVWGKFAEPTSKLLQKGDRIFLTGDMVEKTWLDDKDAAIEHSQLDINTNFVFPYLPDLESLRYKPRKAKDDNAAQDE